MKRFRKCSAAAATRAQYTATIRTMPLLDERIPAEQAEAKRDIGYVSDDMRLFANATLEWPMRLSIGMSSASGS